MNKAQEMGGPSVAFGGFDTRGENIVMRFILMKDGRNVGELTYELPQNDVRQSQRIVIAHVELEECLDQLTQINHAMLNAAKQDDATRPTPL